ncbi:MAG: hypothetical protein Fur005_07440 [Roseiflexaceae bacterium]
MSITKLTIILADDHQLVRRALRGLLEATIPCEVVGEASDGRMALSLIEHYRPQLLISDLSMPGLNGVELTRRIRASGLPIRILILSMHGEEEYIRDALLAGADAYVRKEALAEDFIRTVRDLAQNQPVAEFAKSLPNQSPTTSLRYGRVTIQLAERQIVRDSVAETLTPTEVRVLNELLRTVGEVLTYDTLLRRVWGECYGSESRYLVYEQIRSLRRKLGDDPRKGTILKTVAGAGYLLVAPDQHENAESLAGLTEREHEIAILVAQGMTNRAIADRLGINVRTVETYLRRIFPKIGVSTRTALAAWAIRSGISAV